MQAETPFYRWARLPGVAIGLLLLCHFNAAAITPGRYSGYDAGQDELVLQPFEASRAPQRKTTSIFKTSARQATPALQLALARELETTDSLTAAAKACDALVRRWPYAPEAATAQLRLAEILQRRGRVKQAFDAYHYLIHFYPESAPLRKVLKEMQSLTETTLARGKRARALDMYLTLAEQAPNWSGTPAVLLAAGKLQQADKEWFDALETFEKISASFPESAEAESGAAAAAHILHRLSLRYREDDAIQRRAQTGLNSVLRRYPGHAEREELQRELAELTARRYEQHYRKAAFYDSPRFKPAAAMTAYREFIRLFPHAPQVPAVQQRLSQLAGQQGE